MCYSLQRGVSAVLKVSNLTYFCFSLNSVWLLAYLYCFRPFECRVKRKLDRTSGSIASVFSVTVAERRLVVLKN